MRWNITGADTAGAPPLTTPHEFIKKGQNSPLKEPAAAQEHFLDLCHALEEKTPAQVDATGLGYAFEVEATQSGGGHGFADVFKRSHCAREYKGTSLAARSRTSGENMSEGGTMDQDLRGSATTTGAVGRGASRPRLRTGTPVLDPRW